MGEVIEHKCPACGGTLQFDATSQKVKCPFCDSEYDISQLTPNEGDLTTDLASNGGEEWEEAELYGISEYQCQSCGGDIYTDGSTSATMCPYCGSAVMLKGRLSGTLKPDRVIPFQQTKDAALSALQRHISSKSFVPKNFLANNKLEEVKGLYVPFWVYDAEIRADVHYEGIDERTYTRGDTEYTERKYYDVWRNGDISFDHVPADGSSKMQDDLMESIEPFDYSKSQPFTTGYLTGYVADKYDVDQDAVRPRVRKRLAEGAADAFRSTVSGYDYVSTTSSTYDTLNSKVDYVLYPVWLINTDWDGRKFSFAMNGQTGKMVGNLPLDKAKLSAVALGIFLAISVVVGAMMCLVAEEINIGAIVMGMVFGGIAAFAVYGYFKNKLRSVEFQHGASDYYRPGSMNVTGQSDTYLYTRTTSRRIKND